MTGCEQLSDRMPAVAHGRSAWSREEAAHLAGCGDCRAEWALVQGAARMGSGLPAVRPAERTIAELAPRLQQAHRDERRTALRRAALRWGGLAAAAALALAVVWRAPAGPASTPASASVFTVPLAELDLADAEELRAALDAFEAPITDGSTLERSPGVGEVESDDLERVLRAWEG